MALDLITVLLMVRESHAQQRRDLLSENCERDAVTGELILATFNTEAWDGLCEIDRWLEMIDASLIAAGTDPQPPAPDPVPSNVVYLSARNQRAVRAARSDGWTGGAA